MKLRCSLAFLLLEVPLARWWRARTAGMFVVAASAGLISACGESAEPSTDDGVDVTDAAPDSESTDTERGSDTGPEDRAQESDHGPSVESQASDGTDAPTTPAGDDGADGTADTDQKGDPEQTSANDSEGAAEPVGDLVQALIRRYLGNTVDAFATTLQDVGETLGQSSDGEVTVAGLSSCRRALEVDPDSWIRDANRLLGTDLRLDVGSLPSVEQVSETLRKLSPYLVDDIFRPELVQSTDGTTTLYVIDPEQLCGRSDPGCLDELVMMPLWAEVTLSDDSSLEIVLTDARVDSPIVMTLSDTHASIASDLSGLLDLVERLSGTEREDSESLTGVLRIDLTRNATEDFSLLVGNVDPVIFSTAVKGDDGVLESRIEAAQQAVSVRVNGELNTMSLAADWNEVDVAVPGSALCGESACGDKEREGGFSLHLGGFSFGTTLEGDLTEITVTGLGLGETATNLKLDEDSLAQANLNADNGRRVTLQFQETPEGLLVSFDPVLDFQLAMALENLSSSLAVDYPEWLQDEIFDVTFGGDARARVLLPDRCSDADYDAEVIEGSLMLDATSLGTPVFFDAGQCLATESVDNDDTHPFAQVEERACQ